MEEEHDNLRQALTLYAEETENPEAGAKGLRLGAALQEFWWTRGHLSEGRERLNAVLAHPGGQEATKARASALNGAGALAEMQGDYTQARLLYEQSLAIDLIERMYPQAAKVELFCRLPRPGWTAWGNEV